MVQQQCRWSVLADPAEVARLAVDRICRQARRCIEDHGRFALVLAGGRTPEKTYRLLSGREEEWSKWQLYFGDERCLPADHPERNSVMATRAWLEHVDFPPANVHRIPAEQGADKAARVYSRVVETALPFDGVVLGMGEDGHTASLFPGQRHPRDAWVHAVHDAPKPPPDRVSLSLEALSSTRAMWVLVTGASKAEAVRRWYEGDSSLPVAQLRPANGVDVLLDVAAASRIPR